MIERIPQARLSERVARTRTIMAGAGVRTLLIFGRPARLGGGGPLAYLAGWAPGTAASSLILPAEGDLVVISAGPNITRVFAQRLVGLGAARAYADEADLARKTVDALVAAGGPIGTFGEADMGRAMYQALSDAFPTRTSLDQPLNDMRLFRDADEVVLHQRGAEISVEMVRTAMDIGSRQGATPADIMVEAEARGRRLGAEFAGLWLATGEAPPVTCFELFELEPTLGSNDRIQLGTTVQVEGYFAQCLRTGALGKPSRQLLDVTARLVEMQDRALETLVPGEPLFRLSDVLEAGIDAVCPHERSADPFRFQSCHALGINYAEPGCAGVLNAARDKRNDAQGPLVAENMVIEIHPNFTMPSLGHVCIGDMALVTPAGARWITNLPRDIVRLD